MGCNQVGDYELLLALSSVLLKVCLPEAVIDLNGAFAHALEHAVTDMLGSDLQLSADMVSDKFLYKKPSGFLIRAKHQIVKADTTSYEDLLDSWYRSYRLKLPDILHMGAETKNERSEAVQNQLILKIFRLGFVFGMISAFMLFRISGRL